MHTPLIQKADGVPTPDPTLQPNYPLPCAHWLACFRGSVEQRCLRKNISAIYAFLTAPIIFR